MEKPHYYKLGATTSPGGAIYIVNDAEGEVLAQAEIYKDALKIQGVIATPEIEKKIILYCKEQKEKDDREVASLGIPEIFKELLSFIKKSKAVAFCKRIIISENDLYLLIRNCSQIGFTCRSKFTEFVPKNRKILDSDIIELKKGKTQSLLKKLNRIFEERKRYSVHLFERNKEWHCFYNTYQDMEQGEKRHWEKGSHIHYLSHLWTEYRKKQVWDSFDKRNIEVQGIHIKLKPFEIDESKRYTFSIDEVRFIEKLKMEYMHK
jgi:hypothetical protein